MQTRQSAAFGLSTALAGVLWIASETPAHACGGTFCDGVGPMPPASMQVEQTGETILFAWGDGFVEAHVQIAYDGNDATKFAWIVPVEAVPEIEVGSARLFQAALDSTRPSYGIDATSACGGGAQTTIGFIQDPSGEPPEPPPEVVVQDVVGAFEYAVLQGGTAQTVTDWLTDNGYSSSPDAPEILDAYIDDGFVFVAFKLRHEVDITDLHPIVLRYAGDEPCVPLRLTRVAAKDDMPIRVLTLAHGRGYPQNWRHVQLNRTRLDWVALGANYDELVSLAVDQLGADGRAFVTEYAGSSSIVDRSVMTFPGLDAAPFEDIAVTEVYAELYRQGLASCGDSGCSWGHELVPSLLHELIPVPDGVAEGEFYACLPCHEALIDVAGWDPHAFAAAFDERILAPLRHAHELLDAYPTLTRLYTLVSPHEMLSDPTFVAIPGSPVVAFEAWAQTQGDCCTTVRVPGGRMIELDADGTWPDWPTEMPWAERIEELLPPDGVRAELVNLSAEIDAIVEQRAATFGCNATGSTAGGGGNTTFDPPPDEGGGGGVGESESSSAGAVEGADGCACAAGRSSPRTLAIATFVLGVLVRRRRS